MVALAQRGFRHEALFYASRDEFLERTLEFLQAGIEADEPTLVVLNRDTIGALRSELGPRARGACRVGTEPRDRTASLRDL